MIEQFERKETAGASPAFPVGATRPSLRPPAAPASRCSVAIFRKAFWSFVVTRAGEGAVGETGAVARGRQRDRAVAECMGYRVEEGFGEFDPVSGRLVFTHGLKDFKESEACLCERGLFRLVLRADGGKLWEEVPPFSAAGPAGVEECLVWLRAWPGVRPGLRWRAQDGVWEAWVEVEGRPSGEWSRAIGAVAGDAVTATLLQWADGRNSALAVEAD